MSQRKQTMTEIDAILQQQLPTGYTLRPSTLADVPGAVAMHNASAVDTLGAPIYGRRVSGGLAGARFHISHR
ncbi:MAG: hypothetical protein R3E79_06355 [Caldilineaceae bacterium]